MMPGTWATLFKKTAEQPGTLLFADTAGNLRMRPDMGITGDIPHRPAGTHLRVPCSENDAAYMGADSCARAHRARFKGHD